LIYIDQLSFKTSVLAYKLIKTEKIHGIQQSVQVLDPIKNTPLTWILQKGMRLFGISLSEAVFFSGDLRTKDGFSIFVTAKNFLIKIAYKAAERTINGSKILSVLNKEWGRNTILLYLSRCFWISAGYAGHHTIFKILVADALSRNHGDDEHYLVLGLPGGFTADLLEDIGGSLNLSTYSLKEWSIGKNRLSVLLLIIYISIKRFLKRTTHIFQSKPLYGDVTRPALLLLKEDDLSMDRSYRSQPHWLFKNNLPPEFRTLILVSNNALYQEPDHEKLEQYQVYSVPKGTIYYCTDKHAVQKKINSVIRVLLIQSFFKQPVSADIAFQLSLLFIKASLLAGFCKTQNVKAFMTCENYYHDATAMNLIGKNMGIHSLSYQYANLGELPPPMMTTADSMFTFSPLSHERWSKNGIQPKSFIDIGYLFDSSFDLVEERATELRKRLMNNSSQFIICYFDENVQSEDSKYGIIGIEHHYEEILTIAKLVIQDPSTAVIIKTQFRKNTPAVMFKDDKIIESAKATGRFVELFHGKHRNMVFPAEAAMAADLVIGHCVGSTAGLEAALSGSRCILLNPYDMQGSNIEIFKQAGILYENMDSALSAISFFRQDKPEYRNLGVWSSIINLFDPFQDRKSAIRLRELLEEKILA